MKKAAVSALLGALCLLGWPGSCHGFIDPALSRFSFRSSLSSELASSEGLNEDLFVFPSMGMSRIHSSSHGPPPTTTTTTSAPAAEAEAEVAEAPLAAAARLVGQPEVEVTYHGEQRPAGESGAAEASRPPPPLIPTPLPRRRRVRVAAKKKEAKQNRLREKLRRKPKSFAGTTVTAATWNPDAIDHTVNPNKSRKVQHTTPLPAKKRAAAATPAPMDSKAVTTTPVTRPRTSPMPKRLAKGLKMAQTFPEMDKKYKDVLENSVDHRAWNSLKENYLGKDQEQQVPPQLKVEEMLTLEDAFGPQEKFEPKLSSDLLQREQVKREQLKMLEKIFPNFPSANSFKLQAPKKGKHEAARSSSHFENFPVRSSPTATATEKPARGAAGPFREGPEQQTPPPSTAPRYPRDYAISQTLNSADSIAVHTSAAIGHPGTIPGAYEAPKSYQSFTIITPKTTPAPTPAPATTTQRPWLYDSQEGPSNAYLPPQIALHTTATPEKASLPPHLKTQDTVVLNLPQLKPTDIPDGYELIPLDQLTHEYEVVPWNEAKKVLNVTVSSLGEPKHMKEGRRLALEPQSGYGGAGLPEEQSFNLAEEYHKLPNDYHDPRLVGGHKETHAAYSRKEPMSGYSATPTTTRPPNWHQSTSPTPPGGLRASTLHPSSPRPTVKQLPREPQSGYSTTYAPFPRTTSLPPRDYPEKVHIVTPQSAVLPHKEPYYFGQDYGEDPVLKNPWPAKPQPPPVSPDLPPLFYDDHPNAKPGAKLAMATEADYGQPPPVVKSLGPFHPAHKKKEYGPRLLPLDSLAGTTPPPHVKKLKTDGFLHLTTTKAPEHPEVKSLEAYSPHHHQHHYEPPTPRPKYLPPTIQGVHPKVEFHAPKASQEEHWPVPAREEYLPPKKAHDHPKLEHTPSKSYLPPPLPALKESYKELKPRPTPYHLPPGYQEVRDNHLGGYSSTTPPPPTPTTSPFPYKHWSHPDGSVHHHVGPTKESYVSINIPHKEGPGPNYVTAAPLPKHHHSKGHHHHKPVQQQELRSSPEPHYYSSPKPSYQSSPKPSYYSHPKPGHHSTPKPSYHSTPKPSYHSTPKPSYHSTPKPSYHSTPKPSYHSTPKPSYHSTPKPSYHSTPKPSYHSTPEPSYHSTPEPSYHSTPKPGYHTSPKPSYHSSPKPSYHSTPEPHYKPAHKPAYHSSPSPSYKSSPKPDYHHSPKPKYPPGPKPNYKEPPGYVPASPKPEAPPIAYSTPYQAHGSIRYSTPEPHDDRKKYVKELKLTTPSPYGHSANPFGFTTAKPYQHGAVKGIHLLPDHYSSMPTTVQPVKTGYGYTASPYTPGYAVTTTFAPTTHQSVVKSLPGLHLDPYYAPKPPGYGPTPYSPHHGGNPLGDIPIHVNHFPTPTPMPAGSKKFYTTPKPVYNGGGGGSGGLVKGLPQLYSLPASYSSYLPFPYKTPNPEDISQPDIDRLDKLRKYLSSIEETDAKPNAEVIRELLNSIAEDHGNPKDIKVSIPTAEPREGNINIGSLSRDSGKPQPFSVKQAMASSPSTTTVATTSTTSTATTLTTTATRAPTTSIPSSGVWFMGEDGKKKHKFIPGQVLIKDADGDITIKEGGLMIKEQPEKPEKLRIVPIPREEPIQLNPNLPFMSTAPPPPPQRAPPQDMFRELLASSPSVPQSKQQPSPAAESMTLFEQIMNVASVEDSEEQPYSVNFKNEPLTKAAKDTMIVLPSGPGPQAPSTLRISAYDKEKGNNIVITNNTEETLNQLTLTLRSLTTTIRSLNNTIMETAEDMREHAAMAAIQQDSAPTADREDSVAVQMIGKVQKDISNLAKTVAMMQQQQRQPAEEPVTKTEIKNILQDVVTEAQKVAKLKSNLAKAGSSSQKKKLSLVVAGNGVKSHKEDNVNWYAVASDDTHLKQQLMKLQEQKELQTLREKEQLLMQQEQLKLMEQEMQGGLKSEKLSLKPSAASSGIGLFEMMGHMANKNHAKPVVDSNASPVSFNIPVSASMSGSVGASLQVVGNGDTPSSNSGGLTSPNVALNPFTGQKSVVVGSAVPVNTTPRPMFPVSTAVPHKMNHFTTGPSSNNHAFSFSTTMKPLSHAFSPSNDLKFQPSPSSNTLSDFHPLNQGLVFPPEGQWSPTPLPGGTIAPPKRAAPSYGSNGLPVRFPESNQRADLSFGSGIEVPQSLNMGYSPEYYRYLLQHQQQMSQQQQQLQQQQLQQQQLQQQEEQQLALSQSQQRPQFSTSYYSSAGSSSVPQGQSLPGDGKLGQPKSGVNIMADLAEYTERKNLLSHDDPTALISSTGYVSGTKHQSSGGRPSMEVIMYPSGQLLKNEADGSPPSSTISPRLETALLNSYYRSQLPHYVLAKNRRVSIDASPDTEVFDPLYESDEVYEDDSDGDYAEDQESSGSTTGLIPMLIRTAKDDLKLMGNVIKLALT